MRNEFKNILVPRRGPAWGDVSATIGNHEDAMSMLQWGESSSFKKLIHATDNRREGINYKII